MKEHKEIINEKYIHADELINYITLSVLETKASPSLQEREREIKFIGLFEDRGHRGPYSPYKPFNHNLYIGIIIFPHIDNP